MKTPIVSFSKLASVIPVFGYDLEQSVTVTTTSQGWQESLYLPEYSFEVEFAFHCVQDLVSSPSAS
jgi:hypothetical protein